MQEQPFDPRAESSEDVRTRFFVDGKWREPAGAERFDLISPVTEQLAVNVPAGAPEDMEATIAAVRRAFDRTEWPHLLPFMSEQAVCIIGRS